MIPQKVREPQCETKQESVRDLEQLQIDFVAVREHEGYMKRKTAEPLSSKTCKRKSAKNNPRISRIPQAGVVGIVDSAAAWRVAERLPEGAVDFLEWRADALGLAIPRATVPWIVTARHPDEGGQHALSAAARRDALLRLLPEAALVDIEVRSLATMKTVVQQAQTAAVRVLASFHDFKKTPAPARLREVLRRAEDQGADAVKIATVTTSARDIARLLELFGSTPLPLALMGMGSLGMASRVLFAACGSVLNYGWLHQANVPGQWAAVDLRGVLKKCAGA